MTKSDSRSTTIRPGYTVIFCTDARGLDAGAEAEIEWGPAALLGYTSEQPGHEREGYRVAGYVAAHRTGPTIPVLLPLTASAVYGIDTGDGGTPRAD